MPSCDKTHGERMVGPKSDSAGRFRIGMLGLHGWNSVGTVFIGGY